MAHSKPSISGLCNDRALECSICLANFNQPKQLPCQHIFCLKCLQDYCKDKAEGEMKPCPVCRREFSIPSGGVETLIGGEFIMWLVKEEMQGEQDLKCELCVELGEEVKAQAFCVDCSQRLCGRCKQLHSKQTVTKVHKVVDIGEMPSNKDRMKTKPQYCVEHGGKEIELYCEECGKLLCCVCLTTDHNKHECSIVAEVAEEKRSLLLGDQTSLKRCHERGNEKFENLTGLRTKILDQVTEARNCVENSFDRLVQQITSYKSGLIEKLDEIESSHTKEIAGLFDSGRKQNAELTSFIEYSSTVIEGSTDCEIIRVADELTKRVKKFTKRQSSCDEQLLAFKRIKFEMPPLLTEEHLQKHFGSVSVTGEKYRSKLKDISRLVDDSTDGVRSVQLEEKITGMTVVDGRLYVIQKDFNAVYVCDSKTLAPQPYISVSRVATLVSIAGCSNNKLLYVIDSHTKRMYRVDLRDSKSKLWLEANDYVLCSVSVSSSHSVLVTVRIKNTGGESRIVEYSSDLQIIREIALDTSIKNAWTTLQYSSDEFIISYGVRYHNILCVVNSEGKFVKKVYPEDNPGRTVILRPDCISIERNCEHLLVNDFWNDKLLIFEKDLALLFKIETDRHLDTIYIDPVTNKLFVSDEKTLLCV